MSREIFEQLIRQSDPYSPYAGAVNALNFRATKPGQEATGIGVGFAKAILAGLLKGKSDRYRIDQTALTNDYLQGGEAEGLDELIRTGLERERLQTEQAQKQKTREALQLEFLKGELEEPEQRLAMRRELGLAPDEGAPAEALGGDSEFSALPSVLTSRDKIPTVKDLKAQGWSTKDATERVAELKKETRDSESHQFDIVDKQVDRINKEPAVGALKEVNSTLARLANITDVNTKSSDIPFATIFIGGLDGSVVREGEYSRASESNALVDKWRQDLLSTIKGESQLSTKVKKQMFRELMQLRDGIQQEAERVAKPYAKIAKKRTGEDITLPFEVGYEFKDPFEGLEIEEEQEPGLLDRLMGGTPAPTPTPDAIDDSALNDSILAEMRLRGIKAGGK